MRTTRALVGRKAASYSAIAIVRRIPHHEIQKRDF
jgi:hypothetical protein